MDIAHSMLPRAGNHNQLPRVFLASIPPIPPLSAQRLSQRACSRLTQSLPSQSLSSNTPALPQPVQRTSGNPSSSRFSTRCKSKNELVSLCRAVHTADSCISVCRRRHVSESTHNRHEEWVIRRTATTVCDLDDKLIYTSILACATPRFPIIDPQRNFLTSAPTYLRGPRGVHTL